MKIFKRAFYSITNGIYDLYLEIERVVLKFIIKVLPDPIVHPDECQHRWRVESVEYDRVWLELICWDCQSHGVVKNPTSEEWSEAYGASEKPYFWTENHRVEFVRCFGKQN